MKTQHPILDNTLIIDNVSEALNECIENGYTAMSMLICEGIDNAGDKFQVHISIVYDKQDFIENNELFPEFKTDDQNRLIP